MATRRATIIGGVGGSGGGDNCATWDLNNLTVSAPSVRVRNAGNAAHLRGWLVKAIASDLTVQIVRQSDSTVVGTITIPHTTALETIVDVTSFSTSPFPISINDLLRPNITASDSSMDPAGVAVVTLGWA